MLIEVSDPALVEDLCGYLRRCSCSTRQRGPTMIDVAPPERECGIEQAYLRMEVDAYLRVWRAMHPGVSAALAA